MISPTTRKPETKSAKEASASVVNSYFKKNVLEEMLTTKASRDAFTHYSLKHDFLFKSNDRSSKHISIYFQFYISLCTQKKYNKRCYVLSPLIESQLDATSFILLSSFTSNRKSFF